jgi:hypothetical protein
MATGQSPPTAASPSSAAAAKLSEAIWHAAGLATCARVAASKLPPGRDASAVRALVERLERDLHQLGETASRQEEDQAASFFRRAVGRFSRRCRRRPRP